MGAVALRYPIFRSLNTEVLAVSTDSIYSHKIFLTTSPNGRLIRYPVLSDRPQEVSRCYGVLNEREGFAWRAAFIIDPNGLIKAYIVNPQPVGRNINELVRLIQADQFTKATGRGAQAGWVPGNPGIPVGWPYVGRY